MKYLFTFLIFVFIYSCDKKQENTNLEKDTKPLLSIVQEYSAAISVDVSFEKDIEDWKQLKTITVFLERFKKASPKEILSNALELQGLVKSLNDTVKPQLFDNPSFKSRVNIFYNETLRLSDMTTIPAIKAEEVNQQTEKVIAAFSAVNSKVNSILSKKRFEDAIEVDVKFIGLDSTKMDSISKKSIKEDELERSINKLVDKENLKIENRKRQ